jgi:hypothetical protein
MTYATKKQEGTDVDYTGTQCRNYITNAGKGGLVIFHNTEF